MARPICILHLSDLHLPAKDDADIKIVIDALLKDIQDQVAKGVVIDLVIFSGDLVQKGEIRDAFDRAQTEFIDKVIEAAKITPERFFICPGNHDIDREVVRRDEYVEVGLLSTLKIKSDINKFIDAHSNADFSKELPAPIKRLENYYTKVTAARQETAKLITPFLSVYEVPISGITVGVACFNSAWRTTGQPDDADQGNLIVGERTVDQAAEVLKKAEVKIAVCHHPLHWLHDTDQAAVASRLQAEFDILMYGHVHRASPEKLLTMSGELIRSQGACLYKSREFFNGYNTIFIDRDGSSVTISLKEYSDERREFIPATRLLKDPEMKFSLPSRIGREVSPLVPILLKAKPNIRNLANKHISLVGGAGDHLDIETHFVCPTVKRGLTRRVSIEAEITPKEQITELLKGDKSIVFVGRPEGGKTSLAHYLADQTALGQADTLRLPLIGNFADLQKGDRILWRLVRDYSNEISDSTIDRSFIEKEPLLIIVDDVDLLDQERTKILTTLISNHKNVRWILMATHPASGLQIGPYLERTFPNFETARVQDLSRSAIRELSTSWMQSGDDVNRADAIYRSVMEQIHRTGLPRSGYIVSLILWAIKNKSRGELLNEAVLLQNIIDFMLGRMDYTGALRSELDFTTKSSILQHMAMHFKETTDIKEKNDVLQFVISLLEKKGLKYDAAGLLNSFISCGILDELGSTIAFRYKRFQDFFVAGHLRDNDAELKRVIEEHYFDFRKELDLFTARFRHEKMFLDVGKKYLEDIKIPEPKFGSEEAAKYLGSGNRLDFSRKQLEKMRKEPMTAEKVDGLLDKAERRVAEKQAIETKEKETTGIDRSNLIVQFHMALELYSQFIRNLEFIDKGEKQAHLRVCFSAWEKSLRGWLSSLAEALQDIQNDIARGEQKEGDKNLSKLLGVVEDIWKNVIPTVVADTAYRNLGSEKLVEFIDELGSDKEAPDTLKVLTLFVLLELSPETAIERLRQLSEEATASWIVAAITHRLFSYYTSRPLSGDFRKKFEDLVVDLEFQLTGTSPKGNLRGRVLTEIQKQAFKDEGPK